MIIDFHTHTFPDKIAGPAIAKLAAICNQQPFTNGTVSQTLQKMREWKVNRAVLLSIATKPSQQHTINDCAIALNREHGNQVTALGCIHYENPDVTQELERIAAAGIKGIKIHPDYQQCEIDDPRWDEAFSTCQRLGLFVLTHAGYDPVSPDHIYAPVEKCAKVISRYPDLKLVLAHFGGMYQWEQAERLLIGKSRNLWLDTAMVGGRIPKEQYLRMIRNHGADRILLASDCPWSTAPHERYALEQLQLTKEELDQICWKNAADLLSLSI